MNRKATEVFQQKLEMLPYDLNNVGATLTLVVLVTGFYKII